MRWDRSEMAAIFDYWNNVPHYFSFNVAGWHLISLGSTSELNQTTPDSPQYQWLAQELSSTSAACTIAFFHHPFWTVGPSHTTAARLQPLWSLLAERGVDLVLTGHEHDYQRWRPLDAAGKLQVGGTTEFVVGTGGHGIQSFIRTDSRMVRGFDTPPEAFGALRLELNQHGAAFQFVDTENSTLDSGSVPCSGAPSDTAAPTSPTNLRAAAPGANRVDLTRTSSTDNVGVTGYDIYRNDQLVARAGPATAYSDTTVLRGTTYQYRVRVRDATGRVSGWSNIATVTTPLTSPSLFADGFETSLCGTPRWGWSCRVRRLPLAPMQPEARRPARPCTHTSSSGRSNPSVLPDPVQVHQPRSEHRVPHEVPHRDQRIDPWRVREQHRKARKSQRGGRHQ
jgi:hypothetical protein